jgi:hypothetical protein
MPVKVSLKLLPAISASVGVDATGADRHAARQRAGIRAKTARPKRVSLEEPGKVFIFGGVVDMISSLFRNQRG